VDAAAIERLYRSHGHLVLRRARRLLGNEEDAREVLHDVFASLLDRPAQLRDESAPTTWLYAATTHGCLNVLRNKKTRSRLLGDVPAPSASGGGPSPESTSILRDLLARVPPDLVQIAVYYYADEMTHAEIAAVLGCSRRHVGDLIERLHASLHAVEPSP
jgi:DNA-directed RNA polymerase specialized sigma24 family protein